MTVAEIQSRKEELERLMGDPAVLADKKKLAEFSREYKRVREMAELQTTIDQMQETVDEARSLKQDPDESTRAMAEGILVSLEPSLTKLKERLELLLIPPEPTDANDAIVEFRAGTGGDEAALFAQELMRMYMRYAEREGWKTKVLSTSLTDLGGIKEAIVEINGEGVYGKLKWESGVHRVQRVPATEKAGRIHTSTASVAVLPKVEEEDFELNLNELDIQATTSSGAGGQSVNTTYSAIRIIHKPTGLIVTCQDERSQQQNKAKALDVMRARLFQLREDKQHRERDKQRRSQIGTGERSEKIRTYNYPQDRITDHRIKQNWSNIPAILEGDLDNIITALKKAERDAARA